MSNFQIDGIVPVIPTPFGPEEEIDWAALRSLLDFAASADLNAVCLPAYAGEFYKLSEAERRQVVVVAVDHSKNRVPVIGQVNYPAGSSFSSGSTRRRRFGRMLRCTEVILTGRECSVEALRSHSSGHRHSLDHPGL